MAIASSGSLIDTLRQHGLLSADQLAALPQISQGRCGDARALAKLLIQRSWLTVYQVNQLLVGKGKELAIGSYQVLDRLGQGGLSQVFKARHREQDTLVAIKMIRPEVFASPEGRQQFLQEVEAMARLDHVNIVQFCDADQWEDTYYFAMEYVEGIDLGKVVQLSGAVSVPDACDYIRQAALGLQQAYERNLIHRDIKPVNLFLTHDFLGVGPGSNDPQPDMSRMTMIARPLIKILDWGLACMRHPNGQTPPALLDNVSRSIVGTADYMAPEQARNANMVDIRGDIYSLGCSFYYLLTGQPPFPDGTLMQKILQHQQAEPKPVDQFRNDVPSAVTAILTRMLAKAPENRFQTPASLAISLMPFTRRGMARHGNGHALALKGKSPSPQPDDTPLPTSLKGKDTQRFNHPPHPDPPHRSLPADDTRHF